MRVGGGSSSTNAMMFLENGENEISLEIGALGWFSRENISDQERSHFNTQSGCKVDLVRTDKQSQVNLASINVIINKDGIPEVNSNDKSSIIRKKVLAEQAIPGHIEPKFYWEKYYPPQMMVYQFTKKINISGIPEWQWIHATQFNGSDEQMQKLRAAYIKMADVINNRDREKLKKISQIALKAWSTTTGDSEDDILLSLYPKDKLEGGIAKIDPIKWDNYEVRVMNNGRMVQLYNKSEPRYSPLTYHYVNKKGNNAINYFAPIFSLINGEFVPVI